MSAEMSVGSGFATLQAALRGDPEALKQIERERALKDAFLKDKEYCTLLSLKQSADSLLNEAMNNQYQKNRELLDAQAKYDAVCKQGKINRFVMEMPLLSPEHAQFQKAQKALADADDLVDRRQKEFRIAENRFDHYAEVLERKRREEELRQEAISDAQQENAAEMDRMRQQMDQMQKEIDALKKNQEEPKEKKRGEGRNTD